MKPLEDRDFLPCPDNPIISAPGRIPNQEPQGRLLFEKVTELAFCQNETCRVTRERDALAAILTDLISAKDEKDAYGESARYREMKLGLWERAREILAKLASGELRKARSE